VQRAAKYAEQGQYEKARVSLISNIRMLQRSMNTVSHQNAYLDFVVAGERLDQFMRQKIQEESVLNERAEEEEELFENAAITKKKYEAVSGKVVVKTADCVATSKLLKAMDDDSSSAIFQMKRLNLNKFRCTRQQSVCV
jgi:hypothetical protein